MFDTLSRIPPVVLAALVSAGPLAAEPAAKRGTYENMDYGPVIGQSVRGIAMKALAIRLEEDMAAIFDTELMRFAAGTVDGWIDLSQTDLTSYKGDNIGALEGQTFFKTPAIPGWARDGQFNDPRPNGRGTLPHAWAHYKGFYRHGDRVVLAYSAAGTQVLEWPQALRQDERAALVRTIRLEGTEERMIGLAAHVEKSAVVREIPTGQFLVINEDIALAVGLFDAPRGAVLQHRKDRIEFHIPARESAVTFRVALAEMPLAKIEGWADWIGAQLGDAPDLATLTTGGPARWPEEIRFKGRIGSNDWAYAVDSIPLPEDNPWDSWFRPTGFDFFSDGTRAAVSTWNGDVWIVSGLDERLESVRWKRFASGLFYATGLAIVEDQVYVIERSQLTRLHDLNGNGEADFYENFNNDVLVHGNAHSVELHVDSQGDFYYFKNGNRVPAGVPQHGAVIRVSSDGSEHEVFATGIRGANGMGIGADDMMLAADQEGNWVPATRIDWIQRGKFYGYRPHGGEHLPVGEFEPPICWVPHRVDNSAGGLAWAPDARWGPLAGRWVHTSYGQCHLFVLLKEWIDGRPQGGIARFPLEFSSGLMRARFNPRDGQLYLLGMKGWQTLAAEDGSFDRVRFTGRPAHLPMALNATERGVRITFTDPLDLQSAANPNNYQVERWQYRYTERYGSPEVSFEDPAGENHRDPVSIAAAAVSSDGRTVFLEIPTLAPVMQMRIGYAVEGAGGAAVRNEIYHTIHWFGPDKDEMEWALRREAGSDALPAGDILASLPADGKTQFQMYCAICHQADGGGMTGVAPSLRDSEYLQGSEENLIKIALHGKATGERMMVSFGWLDDERIASVLNHVRELWHQGTPAAISPALVSRVREASSGREEPWTDAELQLHGRGE